MIRKTASVILLGYLTVVAGQGKFKKWFIKTYIKKQSTIELKTKTTNPLFYQFRKATFHFYKIIKLFTCRFFR